VPGRVVFGDEGAVFSERVRSALTGTSKIVIDLCSVDYLDSGGLGILVAFHIAAHNRGGDIKLASPSQRVQDVLSYTKLDSVFSICKTVDEVLAAFSGGCLIASGACSRYPTQTKSAYANLQ
jgi:anti-anti-sigma factor